MLMAYVQDIVSEINFKAWRVVNSHSASTAIKFYYPTTADDVTGNCSSKDEPYVST